MNALRPFGGEEDILAFSNQYVTLQDQIRYVISLDMQSIQG